MSDVRFHNRFTVEYLQGKFFYNTEQGALFKLGRDRKRRVISKNLMFIGKSYTTISVMHFMHTGEWSPNTRVSLVDSTKPATPDNLIVLPYIGINPQLNKGVKLRMLSCRM